MLDHQLQISRSRGQRFLVKPKTVSLSKPKTKSIFSIENQFQTKDIQQINRNQSNVKTYQVCGDQQFKKNYIENNALNSKRKSILNQQDIEQLNTIKQNNLPFVLSSHQDKKQKESIYMNSTQNQNFMTKLNKTQKNILIRENSSLNKFTQVQNKWQKIDGYLKLRIPKSQTVTFGSVNKIYIHENPQKIQIINDMLPQYWKNSLRNNDKKLKSYLKGHHFKQEKAEQMLQTLKGLNKIEKSIPKIGIERVAKVFSKNKSFNLKSNKLTGSDGSQTMRQYHKSLHQNMNQGLRQKSFVKSKGRRFSQTSRLTGIDNLSHDPELFENMKPNEKQIFSFCRELESLDRIDQQAYKKNYDKKSKWILQGLQIGN